MKRKWIFYIAFFTVLVIGFYFAISYALPEYTEVKLPVLSHVQPFSFIDQDSERVTQQDVTGKVYVAEYFFTTCQSICPIMNNNMQQVYKAFKDEPDFLILSHTCDPTNDSAAQLKHYADSMGVNDQHWIFLTGPKDSLYRQARLGYLLDDPKNNDTNIEDQFLHTQFWALVDKNGQVRKIYDGLKQDEIDELKNDIPRLLKEQVSKTRFSNNLFGNNPS